MQIAFDFFYIGRNVNVIMVQTSFKQVKYYVFYRKD